MEELIAAVDGSDESRLALRWAAAMAKAAKVPLTR
jgi:hypothetical protein